MNYSDVYKRVDKYLLNTEDFAPRFINVHNSNDFNRFIQRYNVGTNKFISVSKYAMKDGTPSVADMLNDLTNKSDNIFITGVSTILKLLGVDTLKKELLVLASTSYQSHVVFICFQSEEYLKFSDTRLNRLVYDVDGEKSPFPHLVFYTDPVLCPPNCKHVIGIQNICDAEKDNTPVLYVKTNKERSSFPYSLLSIRSEKNSYEALCNIDPETRAIPESHGTEAEWNYALKEINEAGSWTKWISKKFGSEKALYIALPKWDSFSDNDKWAYFIGLKLFGASQNTCLSEAVISADSYDKLIRCIYRSLLKYEPSASNFWDRYNERKALLKEFHDISSEAIDFIHYVKIKGIEAIYYLTDLTQQEREAILRYLNDNFSSFNQEELLSILKHIYSDLWNYLLPYDVGDGFVNTYFNDYKFQKVVNYISPEFLDKVETQGKTRDFFRKFPPRAELVANLNKQSSLLYFVDALGIEYLSFIREYCNAKGLFINAAIGVCELPSITSLNKDFINFFDEKSTFLIKTIDDIKHHGIDDFDYTKSKLPYYLIKELEIVKDVIDKIYERLKKGSAERAFIISDHGASRLAVINEQENKWTMASPGEHSGRCCLKSDADVKSEYAINENGFWVLANYDRFKGGRKASVEVHGGASLEEVLVPVIELILRPANIEIEIQTQLPLVVSYRKKAEISLFSNTKIPGLYVIVSGNRFNATKYTALSLDDSNIYQISMPEIRHAGEYTMDVYSNGNHIKRLTFDVKKEGASENNIL